VTFGSVFLEIVFGDCTRLPRAGEEVYNEIFGFSVGGSVVTAALAARDLGASVALTTTLGDDLGSRLAEEVTLQAGVDLSRCQRAPGRAAGVTVVLNFDDDRGFITHLPPRPPGTLGGCEHLAQALAGARPAWCYLHGAAGMVPVLHQARALGSRVAVDTSFEQVETSPDLVAECAHLADVFLSTETELVQLTGAGGLAGAISVAGTWGPRLAIKRGAAGAVAVEGGKVAEVSEGLKDTVVVDRTGAGDAFAGALVAALALGSGFRDAVAAGNTAGSVTVGRLGSVGELRRYRGAPEWNWL